MPATAEPLRGGRTRRLLLRLACAALFAGGLWLCGATVASAAEQPDGPPTTTHDAVDAVTRGTETVTGHADTASQQADTASQQAERSSADLLNGVTKTAHSAVRGVPALGHTLAKRQQAPHDRPLPAAEQPHNGNSPDTEPILPVSLGSPAHSADRQTAGPQDTSGSHTSSEPARQHDTAAPESKPEPQSQRLQSHRLQPQQAHAQQAKRQAPPVGQPEPAPSKTVTAVSAHAASTPGAAGHAGHGNHQRDGHLPPVHPDAPSANAGHSGANGDRGGNGGVFAVTSAREPLAADLTETKTGGATVRYAGADRVRPGVAPD